MSTDCPADNARADANPLRVALVTETFPPEVNAPQEASCKLLGLAAYKWLKKRTSRPRPYQIYSAISAAAPALDRFSFPSGHALHAVAFSLVAVAGFPQLAPLVYPFAFLVAVSRPVLGLHYPSDVIAGALLGAAAAQIAILIWSDGKLKAPSPAKCP